jgi:serine/threonine-protein kinase
MTALDTLRKALVGRYAIESPLGRGGMATVYLAQDRKHDRQVAVKVLNPQLAASVGAERFLREIRIAARLAHPHILPLLDSGDANDLLYYVTPYVPGGSLRERLQREGRLGVVEAVRIGREIGAALDYAHRQGFVHRDVKPENILFADGHAVLADFGVARACCGPGAVPVTEVGVALGTAEYMSPEQASGASDLDSRSDLYSLACVVYEMLAGEPPLAGDNVRSTMAKQVTEVPRPLRLHRPEAPASVEAVLERALAKNPEDRFAGVGEFVAALEREAGATGAVAPAPAAAARCIAVLPFVNASPEAENEYLSDGITDELITALANVEGLRVAPRSSVFALKGKPQDVRATGALLGAAWVLEGSVRRSGDRLRITAQLSSTDEGRLIWSERYDRRLDDVFAVQDELARTIVDTLRATSFAHLATPIPRRYTENVKAYALYLKGRHAWNKRTREGVVEAVDYFRQAIAEDPLYALAYAGLADTYSPELDNRGVPIAEGFEVAKKHARKALELDESLAEPHASLAWVLFIYDWDWAGADREFRRAIELNPRYASAHQWYAFLLAARGQPEEGIIESHTALELDSASVSVRRSVGWLYYYARRYDRAIYHLRRAVAMSPLAEESYRLLGLSQALGGDSGGGESVLREAVALPDASAYTLAALGWVLARARKPSETRALLAELERRAGSAYVSPVAFAQLHLALGDHHRALDYAERAYAERRGWLAYVNVNPMLDPLRAESRFQALVEKLRL